MANVTVVGSGYVGMSISVLLAQKNKVTVLDIDEDRVCLINEKRATIEDPDILPFWQEHDLQLKATCNPRVAYQDADFVIVATPTNYDPDLDEFDTTSVDTVVKSAVSGNDECLVIIKSTIPIGYTQKIREKIGSKRIIFSPEFLREGSALHDNLYPSRIIVGGFCTKSVAFAGLLNDAAIDKNAPLIHMDSTEAEAVKLFANTYLAMRVAFFNELDSFSITNNLKTKDIITGMCLDPRIGGNYNNPSFGYGGYCLPKDTKQLLASYSGTPQALMSAIVTANDVRKSFLASQIKGTNPRVIGIYRLIMKAGSDNFRDSAIKDLITKLAVESVEFLIFEPSLNCATFDGIDVISDLDEFKKRSDIILANRKARDLEDVEEKCFSRDVFGDN